MATLIHFDKEDELTEDDLDGLGIGIGHKEDILEDTFEGMGIGIGHRDDKENITDENNSN
jgi:hypothetical protein